MILFANDDSAPRGQGGSQESIARAHEPRGAPFDSPVRATKFQTRNAGPAGLPLHRERERAVAACAHGGSRLPPLLLPQSMTTIRGQTAARLAARRAAPAPRASTSAGTRPSPAAPLPAFHPHPVASARSDDMSYIYTRYICMGIGGGWCRVRRTRTQLTHSPRCACGTPSRATGGARRRRGAGT
uniref:Uncharacterized protein n=1 Tax=Zea mays TaxID=4577 RepID=C0PLR8_MAIZE|nr:unknown [Zea mays]